MTEQVVMCFSGGKDSALALYALCGRDDCDVVALLTTVTAEYDRISMHGVRRSLLHEQARSLGIPLSEIFLSPAATNEEYEAKFAEMLERFRQKGVRTVAFGDIFLEDLREYRERQLAQLEMQCLFPIWKRDTRELIRTFLALGFGAVTTCVDPRVLDRSFVGREIDCAFLDQLPVGVDPCGENGEFHSFVFKGPLFENPVPFALGEIVLRDSFLFCDLVSESPPEHADGKTAACPVRTAK